LKDCFHLVSVSRFYCPLPAKGNPKASIYLIMFTRLVSDLPALSLAIVTLTDALPAGVGIIKTGE
jgi:hypothetical protein